MSKQEKQFAEGIYFKRNENQPDFVIGKLSIKNDDFAKWFKDNKGEEWTNLSILISKGGKPYIEVDTWKPDPKEIKVEAEVVEPEDDLPF